MENWEEADSRLRWRQKKGGKVGVILKGTRRLKTLFVYSNWYFIIGGFTTKILTFTPYHIIKYSYF